MVSDSDLQDALDWSSSSLGCGRLSLVEVLKSEGSSLVYKLAPSAPHNPLDFIVVRRYVDDDWLAREPYLPANETLMTQFAHKVGLPAPNVVGARLDHVPLVATGLLPGSPIAPSKVDADTIRATADAARMIHQHPIPPASPEMRVFEPHYLFTGIEVRAPDWANSKALWLQAIAVYRAFSTPTARILLHRDFHLGNLLFTHRHITGIVDWVTACFGDPGSDIAHMRWNLLLSHGEEAMRLFTSSYYDDASVYDPVWDIYAVVGAVPDLPTPTEEHIARLETLMARALSALNVL